MLNYQQGSDKYKVAVRQLLKKKKKEFGDDSSISAVNTMDRRRLGLTIFLWNTLFQKSGTQIHI